MKASQILAAGALVAPALAQNRTEIVTITNTAYTTYCPVCVGLVMSICFMVCVLILSGAYHYSHWQHDLYRQQGYYSYHHQYVGPSPCFLETMLLNSAVDCPCTLTKTGWFKPTPTPTAQPVCPGGEDCGNNGGNPGGNGGNGGGSECNGKDCGNNGGNGGNPGGNGGNNGNNGGNECNGKDCGNNGDHPGSNWGNPGSNGGNPGSNGGSNGNHGGSGNSTPAPQGGCDEKTGAGCPADQTATGAQPTGTSVVVAGANVNGLSAGAMVVAGFAAMML